MLPLSFFWSWLVLQKKVYQEKLKIFIFNFQIPFLQINDLWSSDVPPYFYYRCNWDTYQTFWGHHSDVLAIVFTWALKFGEWPLTTWRILNWAASPLTSRHQHLERGLGRCEPPMAPLCLRQWLLWFCFFNVLFLNFENCYSHVQTAFW